MQSVGAALGAAAGVSAGSSHTITQMLIPEIGRPIVLNLSALELLGTETLEGVLCDHVAGNHPRRGRYELWVGHDDHLLRKTVSAPGGNAHEEIRRNIRINEPIADVMFAPEK